MPQFELPRATTVCGGWLHLRPWRDSDVPALTAMADDPLLQRWNPFTRGDDGVEEWVARRAVWDDHMSWAAVDDHDIVLGSVSVWSLDAANDAAAIGYWSAPEHRGRGVASEATRLATAFAFRALPLERLTLCHAVENPASCGVARRAGFALEGTTRLSWRYPDGELHDEHLHAVIRSDLLT